LLVKGGRVVDPSQPLDALRDVRIDAGLVREVGEHLEPREEEDVFDARGVVVAPGFIDMHVHLRDPGNPEKETLQTGTLAAVHGGFTAVACMPNTHPALDTPAIIEDLLHRAERDAHCRIYPIAAITRERRGTELLDYAALARAGAVAFSDDGTTVMNARVLRDAALAARDVPGVFISHAEDELLKGEAVMNEGVVSRSLGVPGSPAVGEEIIVARDLLLAADTGKAWHIAHLSTGGALAQLQHARAYGALATCEVTPHHLLLTDEIVRKLGGAGKVNPPLRGEDDARALRGAVREGVIDVFATDHAPHTTAEKSCDLFHAAVGFSGLEIAIGAFALAVPDLPLLRFVAMLSTNPARILGVPGGTLEIGSAADLTLFAEREWRVDPLRFASKGKSTPLAGRVLPRRALATIVDGTLYRLD
jgi:dihydroorotase